jgi:hypothetical protein
VRKKQNKKIGCLQRILGLGLLASWSKRLFSVGRWVRGTYPLQKTTDCRSARSLLLLLPTEGMRATATAGGRAVFHLQHLRPRPPWRALPPAATTHLSRSAPARRADHRCLPKGMPYQLRRHPRPFARRVFDGTPAADALDTFSHGHALWVLLCAIDLT